MQLEETLLVVPDNLNGGRIQPRAPLWRWGAYTDVTAPVRVVHQDGSAYSLSGAVSALLAFYEKDTDDEPVLQLQWTIGEANAATFSIPRDVQTLYLPPRDQGYAVGIRFRDDDVGSEDVILLLGRVMIDGRVGDFNAPVVVPSSQQPLAQGPPGPTGATGAQGPVGPAGPAGSFIVTTQKTADYVASDGDLVRCDPSNGDFTVTLPSAAAARVVAVKNQSGSTNTIAIAPSGSDTIDSALSLVLSTPYASVMLYSDGVSDWMVM